MTDGDRMCVGNTFALLEMAVPVATIARRWRLTLAGPLTVAYTSTAYPSRLSMTATPR